MKTNKLNKLFMVMTLVLLFSATSFLAACTPKETEEEQTYNIIMTNATIPPMMATLDAISNGNKTYMWYGRPLTFASVSNLEEQVTLIKKEAVNQTGISSEAVTLMQNQVNQLYSKNTKSKFRFYVTDYGIDAAMRVMVQNRIPEANYKVILLEDGTGSYANFTANFGAADTIEHFNATLEAVNQKITDSWENRGGDYLASGGNMQNWAQAFAYATRPNVEYWLQFPEMLSSNDAAIAAKLETTNANKINFVKKNLNEVYAQISVEKQNIFKNILIDSNINNIMTFENNKPLLMVTGTSYGGEQMGVTSTEQVLTPTEGETFTLADKGYNDMFEATFDYILQVYGNEFNLVLKPHPAWTPSLDPSFTGANWSNPAHITDGQAKLENRVSYLEENDIRVLPGQVPAEAIMWAYPSVYLCGYNSSLYMNEQNGKTLFFIGLNNAAGLSAPVNTLVQNGTVYAGYAYNPLTGSYGRQEPQFVNAQVVINWLADQPSI